jgi:hypothetical protein
MMKTLNFLAIAAICVSCARINEGAGTTNQNNPHLKYPRVALTGTNLNATWTWACHTANLLNLPDGQSFVETMVILGDSLQSTIQVYEDTACGVNAYTFIYASTFTLSTNPEILTEARTQFQLTPLNDTVTKLLNDVAHQQKNPFCAYGSWITGSAISQFFSGCALPVAATRNVSLYQTGANGELLLASCTTATNCSSADFVSTNVSQ